ncbi:peptidoglycan-binding domain-containing protein [Catenuloplanes atrovinosus]|uniref:Peptidoglycan binding-like domain-containing protein n=1 Tax=Catenuloplanes atrovinosus TaxID=137266 RepID=A0AAE4CA82_9ACTN|nr:peptidoglycan-binding domain-containing protein [Catenuloplanes atrovinosus]MDR7276627.1 hypothetical protein [Catenuloplanes atrovinosus]
MSKNKRRVAGTLTLMTMLALWAALLPGGAAQAGVAGTAVAHARAEAEVGCTSFSNMFQRSPAYYLHIPTVGWDSGDVDCVLARGMNNVGVLALQESLNRCYGQGLATDGQFGANTERAVRNAQNIINSQYNAGIAVDGRYGPQTAFWFHHQIYDHNNGGYHTGACSRWGW